MNPGPFFGRRLSFISKKVKGKSVGKVIVFAACGLGQSPGGLSGDKNPNFLTYKAIKRLTMSSKKLYS